MTRFSQSSAGLSFIDPLCYAGKEGHAQEDVGRALVELAGEPALRHVELKQAVAGG